MHLKAIPKMRELRDPKTLILTNIPEREERGEGERVGGKEK